MESGRDCGWQTSHSPRSEFTAHIAMGITFMEILRIVIQGLENMQSFICAHFFIWSAKLWKAFLNLQHCLLCFVVCITEKASRPQSDLKLMRWHHTLTSRDTSPPRSQSLWFWPIIFAISRVFHLPSVPCLFA